VAWGFPFFDVHLAIVVMVDGITAGGERRQNVDDVLLEPGDTLAQFLAGRFASMRRVRQLE
jgi:hypothetical protein